MDWIETTTVKHQPRLGFSLLEVMLATAILAGSSLVLASMISAGSQLGQKAQDRTEAMLVAQSLIDETIALRQGEVIVEQESVGDGERWDYSLVAEADPRTGLFRLVVEVYGVTPGADNRRGVNEAVAAARLVRWYLPAVNPDITGARMNEGRELPP